MKVFIKTAFAISAATAGAEAVWPEWLPESVIIEPNEYVIDRENGRPNLLSADGAFSRVYCATEKGTRDRVAIKVMATTELAAKSLGKQKTEQPALDAEENVIKFLKTSNGRHQNFFLGSCAGKDQQDGLYFHALTLAEGTELEKILHPSGFDFVGLPAVVRMAVTKGLLENLDELRALGIAHRDVKPANVIIGRDDLARKAQLTPDEVIELAKSVLLIDFGIAGIAPENTVRGSTKPIGSAAFMAPDAYFLDLFITNQAETNSKFGRDFKVLGSDEMRSNMLGADLWAVGIMMKYMLSNLDRYDISEQMLLCQRDSQRSAPTERSSDMSDTITNTILSAQLKQRMTGFTDAEWSIFTQLLQYKSSERATPTDLLSDAVFQFAHADPFAAGVDSVTWSQYHGGHNWYDVRITGDEYRPVERRFSEFVRLHDFLNNHIGNNADPTLPEVNRLFPWSFWTFNSTRLRERRARALQNWMLAIMNDKAIVGFGDVRKNLENFLTSHQPWRQE